MMWYVGQHQKRVKQLRRMGELGDVADIV